jgi:Heavy metal associated domain 2
VKPRAYRVHRTPGRIRLKIPERRGDHAFFAEIAELLRRFSAVTQVECNPLTGSLLLHHFGDIDGEPMQAALSVLAELVELELSSPPVARRLRADVVEVDQSIQRYTRGALDLSTAAALGLLALAGFQLLRGQQPVIAVSLAWYATELLRRWQDPSDKSGDPAEQPSSH